MPSQPSDLIAVAKGLASSQLGEAGLRSAVSRAYYGAYHACDVALPPAYAVSVMEKRREGSHQAVIAAMKLWGKNPGSGRLEAQMVARKLAQLKGARKSADYEIDEDWTLDAQRCIADAETIVSLATSGRAKWDRAANLSES